MSSINWAEVAAHEYAVPAGVSPLEVMGELLNLLGQPEPEIRDTEAYSILAGWTRAGHFDTGLERLALACTALLTGENVLSLTVGNYRPPA